jgi:hypothetical protein
MAKPFNELRELLLRAGVAPRHVRRYVAELSDHLTDLKAEEEGNGRSPAAAEAAALVRLGSPRDLARAMIAQPKLHSWPARAPWAVFGLAPLFFLAAAWAAAFFILWSGWQIFLPGADTPFGAGPFHGVANLYFQAGKALYFFAPLAAGWAIGVIAARQRVKAIWPTVGLFLVAWTGGAGQVQASRTAVAGGFGHIRMDFASGLSIHGLPNSLLHALAILAITLLPYLIWRLQRTHSASA